MVDGAAILVPHKLKKICKCKRKQNGLVTEANGYGNRENQRRVNIYCKCTTTIYKEIKDK